MGEVRDTRAAGRLETVDGVLYAAYILQLASDELLELEEHLQYQTDVNYLQLSNEDLCFCHLTLISLCFVYRYTVKKTVTVGQTYNVGMQI